MEIEVGRTGVDDYGPYWMFLLSGRPGVGKTPFAVTGPNPFMINVDAGLTSIAHLNIPKFPASGVVENTVQLESIIEFLGQGPEAVEQQLGFPVETVIVDTVDEVARILIRERKEAKRQDEMKAGDWEWLASQINKIARALKMMDYNVILISHIKDVTDGETGATSYKLDISGAGAHQLPGVVDVALFMDDKSVALVDHTDEEDEYEQMSYLYTQKLDKFEWIKDRTETLPAIIECDFKTGFKDLIDRLNSRVDEMSANESVTVEFEEQEPAAAPAPQTTRAEPKRRSADEAAAKMAEADAKLAEAKAKKQEPVVEQAAGRVVSDPKPEPGKVVERATVATDEDPARSEDEGQVDLDTLNDGEMITVEKGLGFQFPKAQGAKPMQIMGARWVYEVDGGKILSRVKLPDQKVTPIPNPAMDTGLFCQVTGVEITAQEANLSRMRVRKFLCTDEYAKEIQQAKKNMTRT